MSPGGLNGSGIHKLPLGLEEPRKRRRPWVAKLLTGLITAAISVAAAAAVAHIKGKENEASAQASARVVVDQRFLLHETEFVELRRAETEEHKAIRADIKKLSDALLIDEPPTRAVLSPPRRRREPQ